MPLTVPNFFRSLIADTTPQLGGNLDLNNFNITGTGEWQGSVIAAQYGGNIFDIDSDTPLGTPLNSVYRIRHGFDNFLSNSGFEHWLNGASSAPNSWTLQGDATVARSSTATSGSYSAEITFGTANTGELYQAIDIHTTVDYTFSCYVQRASGSGTARLVAQENGADFTEYVSVNLPTSAGWHLVTLTVQPATAGSMRFNIKSGGTTASVWLVDECMLEESAGVATTWTPLSLNDTDNTSVFGVLNFLSGTTYDATTLKYDTTDANANAFKIGLPDGGAVDVPIIHFGRASDIIGVDLAVGNGTTKPQIYHWDDGNGRYHRQGWQTTNPAFYEFVLNSTNQYSFGSIVNFVTATLFPANAIRYIGSVYEQYRTVGINPAHYLSFPANIPWIISTVSNNGVQYSKGTTFANPKMYMTAGTPFATSTDHWGAFEHDASNFLITAGTGMIVKNSVTAGITASTTQSQGQQPLTTNINEVSTVANANDVVTLPAAVVGADVIIMNNGANTLQIFPASGDNLGAGVDTSTTLASGSNVHFVAYDTTNWEIV